MATPAPRARLLTVATMPVWRLSGDYRLSTNGYTYLYLVESVREDSRAKQRIIRKEVVVASGEL